GAQHVSREASRSEAERAAPSPSWHSPCAAKAQKIETQRTLRRRGPPKCRPEQASGTVNKNTAQFPRLKHLQSYSPTVHSPTVSQSYRLTVLPSHSPTVSQSYRLTVLLSLPDHPLRDERLARGKQFLWREIVPCDYQIGR